MCVCVIINIVVVVVVHARVYIIAHYVRVIHSTILSSACQLHCFCDYIQSAHIAITFIKGTVPILFIYLNMYVCIYFPNHRNV